MMNNMKYIKVINKNDKLYVPSYSRLKIYRPKVVYQVLFDCQDLYFESDYIGTLKKAQKLRDEVLYMLKKVAHLHNKDELDEEDREVLEEYAEELQKKVNNSMLLRQHYTRIIQAMIDYTINNPLYIDDCLDGEVGDPRIDKVRDIIKNNFIGLELSEDKSTVKNELNFMNNILKIVKTIMYDDEDEVDKEEMNNFSKEFTKKYCDLVNGNDHSFLVRF